LDDWQQQALDQFVEQILTQAQCRELDIAVFQNLAQVLSQQAEAHLQKET
jgi:hypothetical protein